MRLTQLLLRFRKRPPRGKMDIGKYRSPILIYSHVKKIALADLKIEENNLLLLQNPYLSFQESFMHASESGKRKKFYERMNEERLEKCHRKRPETKLEDGFDMLKNNDYWD